MSINENNIKDIDDSTILENTPMVVIEQGGQTIAIPLMGGGGGEQVQADWSQTNDTAVDFIKNKPEIPSKVTDLTDAEQYAKKTDIPEIAPGMALQNVVIDTTSTEAVIDNMAANTRYVFTQPLTALTVGAIEDSNFESELQFTTGNSISVILPANLNFINYAGFVPGGYKYIINIKNYIAVVAEYDQLA